MSEKLTVTGPLREALYEYIEAALEYFERTGHGHWLARIGTPQAKRAVAAEQAFLRLLLEKGRKLDYERAAAVLGIHESPGE